MYSNEDYLIQLLVEAGQLDAAYVQEFREAMGDEHTIQLMLDRGDLNETVIAQVSAQNAGAELLDLQNTFLDGALADRMTLADAKRFHAVPVADDGSYLSIAIADILDVETTDSIPHVVGRECTFYAATPTGITHALTQLYGEEAGATDASGLTVVGESAEDGSSDAPVIKMVSGILVDAFKMRASDIHIEPLETSLRIRNRVDGKLVDCANHPK
ncbi:type II/IV secretion system protein, partial [Akkermansiaceae bacterium]|nr:type II/IV secretion system protein [Akkermansiaceae bacterium]